VPVLTRPHSSFFKDLCKICFQKTSDLFLLNSSHALLYPSNQYRQYRTMAALHKLRHAVGELVLHALRPTDGGKDYCLPYLHQIIIFGKHLSVLRRSKD
jgi:hypothetical protein